MEKMIERAKEELELLENQHPHRFDYLKLELKSFISLLQAQQLIVEPPLPTTSTATTQASTSTKRRKRGCMRRRKMEDEEDRWEMNEIRKNNNGRKMVRRQNEERDRVDQVLEKAQACLRKLQDFKFSLAC